MKKSLSKILESNESYSGYLMVVYGIFLLAYVAIRANALSFTYDEIVSYNTMLHFSPLSIGLNANNHILNTYLMKISYACLGFSEFALRFPNVLSFPIYFYGAFSISKHLLACFRLPTIVLLTAMPFVIDFFSLARGYGIGLGLMLFSLACLLNFQTTSRILWAFFGIVSAALAVMANFTFLNYFLPYLAILVVIATISSLPNKHKLLYVACVVGLAISFLYSILSFMLALKKAGHLYFGGHKNFFSDTILSLGNCFGYMSAYNYAAQIFFAAIFLASIALALFKLLIILKERKLDIFGGIALIFLLSMLSVIAQNLLLQTPLPVERTAILFYPLMILNLILGLSATHWKGSRSISQGISIVFLLHFIANINFTHCYSWRYDSGTKAALLHLESLNLAEVNLGIDYFNNPSVTFYKQKLGFINLNPKVIADSWEYPLGLEELNPYYYGKDNICYPNMPFDIRKVIVPECNYYYLDRFFADEFKKTNISFTILFESPDSRSVLMQLKGKD